MCVHATKTSLTYGYYTKQKKMIMKTKHVASQFIYIYRHIGIRTHSTNVLGFDRFKKHKQDRYNVEHRHRYCDLMFLCPSCRNTNENEY